MSSSTFPYNRSTNVLLNGRYVEAMEIDPAKHQYIGMFRPAEVDYFPGHCPVCHETTSSYAHGIDMNRHIKKGCFDVPQYINIVVGGMDKAISA